MAKPRSDLPHDFPDRAIRDAVVEPNNLRDLLRRVLPELVDQLDFSSVEEVKRTFLLDDWRRREADVLLRLRFREPALGRDLLVCVLVEHQSTTDPAMPLRLLLYAVLFWEQQWKEWEDEHERGKPLRLTPVLPITDVVRASHNDALLQKEADKMTQQIEMNREQELAAMFEERGRKEGIKEGIKEGELLALRTALRTLLAERFPTVPQSLLEQIDRADVEHLQTALK